MIEYQIEVRNARTGKLIRIFGASLNLSLEDAKRIAERALTKPALIRAGLTYVVSKKDRANG